MEIEQIRLEKEKLSKDMRDLIINFESMIRDINIKIEI